MTLLSVDNLHLVESSIKNKGGYDGVRTWSTAVQILLPVAALAFLWGRRGFFTRFFLQFDKNCVSVFCPSFSKRQRLLKWASGRLPPTWSSRTNTLPGGPAEFWRDGSLLCTLINSAIPGACPNPYRHWRRPPSHGQALAYKYLGVAPIFIEDDFNESLLTPRSEKLLLDYLIEIQQAIMKISLQEVKFSSRYVARGMGLIVGEQYRKTTFYIYSSSTTTASKHDVMVSIRGPYNNSCTATIPAYYASRKYSHDKRFDHQSKAQRSFFRTLSIDFGSFINVGQKENNGNDIPIKAISEKDRVKIIFIPHNTGMHEISIITNGFHLVGSPFNVNVIESTTKAVDVFSEDGIRYTCRKIRLKNMKRRIISRIIDFIDEKVSYDILKNKSHNKEIPKIKITSSSLSQSFSEDERNSDVALGNTEAVENLINVDIETNVSANFTQENAPISNDDHNNNISTISLTFKSPLDSSSDETTNIINTSPICKKHIEKEVSRDVDGTSKIPNRNFEKKPLMRQEKVEIFDSVETSECEEEKIAKESIDDLLVILEDDEDEHLSDTDVEDHHNEETSLASEKAYKNNNLISELRVDQNDLLREKLINHENENENYNSSTLLQEEAFDFKKANESSIEAAFNYLYESSTKDEEEHHMNGGDSQYEVDPVDPESMNILNFMSSLKSEMSSSMSSNINEKLKYLDKDSLFEHKMNFLECLKYWESQANLHIKEERRQCKSRRSLPNLLTTSNSEYSIFAPYFDPKDNYVKSWNHSQDTEFTSQFKQRQDYWKQLSSQATSYSSLSNSITYLENTFKNHTKSNITKSRRSLPELFSNTLKEEYLHQANHRNAFLPDFFSSPEALEFKNKFKERRDFWERLSSQNLNEDSSYLKFFGKYSSTTENCDSGFYNSFPNLYTSSASKPNSNYLTEDDSSLKYKFQYEQRREYWERLSYEQLSNVAVSPVQTWENCKLKNVQSDLFNKAMKNNLLVAKYEKRKIEVGHNQTNLTDDLKQIGDQQSKIKLNFNEARNFFRDLEERIN